MTTTTPSLGSLVAGVVNVVPVFSLAVYALHKSRGEEKVAGEGGVFKFGRIAFFLFFLSFVLAFYALPAPLLGLTSLASTLVILVSVVLFSVVSSSSSSEFTRVFLHLFALLLFSFSSVLFYIYAYYAIEYSISTNNSGGYRDQHYFSCDPLLLLLGETALSEKTQYLDERICAMSDEQMLLMNCLAYTATSEEQEDIILASSSGSSSSGSSSSSTPPPAEEPFRGERGGGVPRGLGVLLSRILVAVLSFLNFGKVKAQEYASFISSYSKLSQKIMANVNELIRKRALKYKT